MTMIQSSTSNALLSGLIEADFALLLPHLTRIPLPRYLDFYLAGGDIEHVYFPEDGIVSIVAVEESGQQVEVGIVGREGMVGTPVLLGTDRSPHHVYIQVEGTGLRLKVDRLLQAMQESATLKALLLRYVQTVMVQSASSTSAAAGYLIEQRLARWLLMCRDRLGGDDVNLTHEFIGMMLGARRAGVTVALHSLRTRHLIAMKRGFVTIEDRPGLERLAGGSYGFAEAEYQRVMGIPLATPPGSLNSRQAQEPALKSAA